MKKSSRMAALKRQKQEILDKIKFFCLTPNISDFRLIISSDFKKREPENFYAWKTATLYKYSIDWGLEYDIETNELLTEEEFLKLDEMMVQNLQKPSLTRCLQTLYVFYATGELKYIDLFYQLMGVAASNGVRIYLSDLFKTTRSEYSDKLYQLLSIDKDHLMKHNVDLSMVDFSHFSDSSIAKYKEIVENKKLAKQSAKNC